MAKDTVRQQAVKLNQQYFRVNRRPTQAKKNELEKNFENFKARAEKQKKREPYDLMRMLSFDQSYLDKIQKRIDLQTNSKRRQQMFRFPLVKGIRGDRKVISPMVRRA